MFARCEAIFVSVGYGLYLGRWIASVPHRLKIFIGRMKNFFLTCAVEWHTNKKIVFARKHCNMLLLALIVGMVVYIIIRLQMINLELTWLRQYIMRLLTKEIAPACSSVDMENPQSTEDVEDIVDISRENDKDTNVPFENEIDDVVTFTAATLHVDINTTPNEPDHRERVEDITDLSVAEHDQHIEANGPENRIEDDEELDSAHIDDDRSADADVRKTSRRKNKRKG